MPIHTEPGLLSTERIHASHKNSVNGLVPKLCVSESVRILYNSISINILKSTKIMSTEQEYLFLK